MSFFFYFCEYNSSLVAIVFHFANIVRVCEQIIGVGVGTGRKYRVGRYNVIIITRFKRRKYEFNVFLNSNSIKLFIAKLFVVYIYI